ncbi:IPT/TIG domain-containing protein [Tenacibaculum sp. MAR_2010_89]|uniref:IPT/TIG domain-containing protein n=1 Tax=Tenacibaculum sp. MAR_2010_89 TaxID=1250198 RepID=UPI00089542E2|nr:IPT/TIG domain-containing protein [Tenacibaculum sp. MAR_2010_89]SEE64925.1 IPT/TIG domain-containing protein [Tenacibaculum sp. MAR_2010_89]
MKITTYKYLLLIIVVLLVTVNLKAQTITSLSPTSGSLGGNTVVSIKGTGFIKDNIVGVYFKKHGAVKEYNVVSETLITFKTTAISSPSIDKVYIEFKKDAKKVYSSIVYEYKLPEISTVSPNSTSVKGKKKITIKGKYFSGTTYVKFGSAGNVPLSVTDTIVTVANPPHVSKEIGVQVEVQSNFSRITEASKFTYKSDKPDSTYVISLDNLTGLDKKYKIYVLGYSTSSQKMLTLNGATSQGTFKKMPSDSGYVKSYELVKELKTIKVSNKNPLVGARIYFFIKDTTVTYKDNSTKTSNNNLGFKYKKFGASVFQVNNPPQNAFPQYNYIEATFKKDKGLFIDISTVDGFFFPLSIIAEDKSGNELDRIGQPHNITAKNITAAYKPFMKKLIKAGEPTAAYYTPLSYSVNKDLTALLNPGLYLEKETSMLETVFDEALNKLFTDTSLKMNIWQNGTNKFSANYTVTPVSAITFPGTTNKHGALKFTASGAETLYAFNPVGFSVVSYQQGNKRAPIMGSINKRNELIFKTPLPLNTGLKVGMYVSPGGGSSDGITRITKINKSKKGIVSVTLNTSNSYSASFQYKFAKAPTQYYYSSGQMTFAGIGLFADGSFRYPGKSNKAINNQTVINGLENQISTALNRGIAIVDYKTAKTAGYTTTNWGKETSWYPKNQPQNYFSYFLHTTKVGGTNIFTLPIVNKTKSSRGDYMGRAYGFAYDENPIGGKGGAQVPSEFPGSFPKGTTQLKLILGSWK